MWLQIKISENTTDTDFSQDRLLSEGSVQRVCFPVGGTHLSLTAGRSKRGSARGLARRPCRARCSALPPCSPGGSEAPPPLAAHGGCAVGARLPAAGRRGRAVVPRPPERSGNAAGAAPGTRPAGGRAQGAPVCRPARDRAKQSAARPRRGEEAGHILGIAGTRGLRGAPALGGAWRRDTRAHAWCRAAGQGEGCRHCRSSVSNSSSPLRSPGLRGGPRPLWGHPRPHRCPPRRSRPARAHLTSKRGPILFFSR